MAGRTAEIVHTFAHCSGSINRWHVLYSYKNEPLCGSCAAALVTVATAALLVPIAISLAVYSLALYIGACTL